MSVRVKRIKLKTVASTVIAFIAVFLMLVNIYALRSMDVFGTPLLFALGLIVELILALILVYALLRALKTPIAIVGSVLSSAWSGVMANPRIKRIKKSRSVLLKWLINRFNPKNPFGLILTIGVLSSAVFFIGFSNIFANIWSNNETITNIDTRILNSVPSIRTSMQTTFFRFITFSANAESVLLLVLLAGSILWRNRQKLAAYLLGFALVLEEGSTFVFKILADRARPDAALSLIHEGSLSFPSGHVMRATVIFGLLAYLLYRSYQSSLLRFGIFLGYLIAVVLVAMSRLYLGVHYPSDVLASILLGASLLVLLITFIEIVTRYKLWGQKFSSFTARQLMSVPIAIISFSLIASPFLIHISPVNATPSFVTIGAIDPTSVKKLPLYSENLNGETMEPINFIYIGSQREIEQLFLSRGWYIADPPTISNTLRALAVSFQDHQYLKAPVTPSYLEAKPQDLAFEQPTQSDTLRQRHHTRLWRTDYRLPNGSEIWVATASYDTGIKFADSIKLPTHHIDPNVDAERSYIVASLGLRNISYLQVVNAQVGKNASGDVFFTDGRAVVVDLQKVGQSPTIGLR